MFHLSTLLCAGYSVKLILFLTMYFEAAVAQGHKSVIIMRRLWVRSPPEGINYYVLIFSLPLASRQKPGVKLRHSMPQKIRRKVGNGVS